MLRAALVVTQVGTPDAVKMTCRPVPSVEDSRDVADWLFYRPRNGLIARPFRRRCRAAEAGADRGSAEAAHRPHHRVSPRPQAAGQALGGHRADGRAGTDRPDEPAGGDQPGIGWATRRLSAGLH